MRLQLQLLTGMNILKVYHYDWYYQYSSLPSKSVLEQDQIYCSFMSILNCLEFSYFYHIYHKIEIWKVKIKQCLLTCFFVRSFRSLSWHCLEELKLKLHYIKLLLFFFRHLSTLKQLYGYQLLINLLGSKEGEASLSQAFRNHLKDSKHNFDTHMIVFDYHRHCTGSGKTEHIKSLLVKAKPSIDNFQFFSKLNGDVIKYVGCLKVFFIVFFVLSSFILWL